MFSFIMVGINFNKFIVPLLCHIPSANHLLSSVFHCFICVFLFTVLIECVEIAVAVEGSKIASYIWML